VALTNYLNDYGALPAAPGEAGQPALFTSNTRNVWLLFKNGYLDQDRLLCPGVRQVRVRVPLGAQELQLLQDFASRQDIHYSFRLMTPPARGVLLKAAPLATDNNPLFMDFDPRRQTLNLTGNAALQQVNSPNHGGAGQNILLGDGSVRFMPQRWLGPGRDDVFTITGVQTYTGREYPRSSDDAFIAP
jgi:hypothetical protein